MNELLKFDIQMFAEEMADNDSDVIDLENNTDDTDIADGEEEIVEELENTEGDSDNDEPEDEEDTSKSTTKKYSERLNKDREKIQEELEKKQEEKLNSVAKSRGFDSWTELEEFSEQQRLENLGVTDKDEFKSLLDELIAKNPIVQKAQEVLASQEQKNKEVFIKEQITEINKLDNNIKTLDDLVKLDRYEDFSKKVEKGYDLIDAYKTTYFDKIKTNEVESVKQNVLNNLGSKGHLKTATGKGGNDVFVPDEVMAMYKKNMPNMSDNEIRKHYGKYVEENV